MGFLLSALVTLALAQAPGGAKRVDVEDIKKQYWGQEESFEVVQNRLYTKAHRLEVNLFGMSNQVDPFQQIYAPGFSLGYHFSEYVSLHAIGWRNFSFDSAAVPALLSAGAVANTNVPMWYAGGEIIWSVIYGKLSLLGKAILYYDLHVTGGGGSTWTETGPYFTQVVGVGQKIYLNKYMAVRFDYRMAHYYEAVLGKNPQQANFNTIVLRRDAFSHLLALGFSFLFP